MEDFNFTLEKGYRSLLPRIVLISKCLTVPTVIEGPNLICYHFSKGRKWKRGCGERGLGCKYARWNVYTWMNDEVPREKESVFVLCGCNMDESEVIARLHRRCLQSYCHKA